MRTHLALLLLIAVLGGAPTGAVARPAGTAASLHPEPVAAAETAYGRLPLHFEQNRGQVDPQVSFLARPPGYTAFATPTGMVFSLRAGELRDVVSMQFVGANAAPHVVGDRGQEGRSHYLLGNDPAAWVTDVPHYGGVTHRDLYPGVELRWHGAEGRALEYDFLVAPGQDASVIEIAFEGAERLAIDESGDLLVRTPHGELRHTRPVASQNAHGERRTVPARFALRGETRVGFEIEGYDRTRAVLIDPVIRYSTYLGGIWRDLPRAAAVDGSGNVYVGGWNEGAEYPTKSPYQPNHSDPRGPFDAVLSKINASGTALVFSTYLGGNQDDHIMGIAVDSSGAVYLGGQTRSTNFPTKSALQGTHGGESDAFVTKLNSSGSALVYSTFHGGSKGELVEPGCFAIDSKGAAYITGQTHSTDLPLKSAIQATKQSGAKSADLFITKLAAGGASLAYSTYYGSSGGGTSKARIAVDAGGAAYVAAAVPTDFNTKSPIQATHAGGAEIGVLKINPAGSSVVYATYLGGGGDDQLGAIAVDSKGAAYVCGNTKSSDFPTKSALDSSLGGATDAFVTKINAAGTAHDYSTYLGGGGGDLGHAIAVDSSGVAHVAGATWSTDFPTQNPLASGGALSSGPDIFVARLSAAGTALSFSTYLGGSGRDEGFAIAVDKSGADYVVGETSSTDFPTKGPLQSSHSDAQWEEFTITKIGATTPPSKPLDLTVTGSTDQRVDLAWGDESLDETGFALERKTEDGAFLALAEPAANATTYADETVAGDTTYTYRIRAVNENGVSAWSNEVAVVTISSPDQLTGDVVSNTRIDLMWRDRSGSEDGFEVERKRAGDDDYLALGSVDAEVTSFADTGADPETTYFFRVRATKGAGASGWSNVAEVTTPPADPADVIPGTRSDTEVRISWKDLSLAETGYEVERGVGCPAAAFARIATVGPDVMEYTDRSASPETTYSYRVRAVNEHGASEYTAPVCITTAPTAPTAFTGDAMSPSRIRLSWSDNSGIEKGYEVQRTAAGRDEWADIADLPADASEYLDVGVSQEAAFSYRVRAYDDNGRSRDAMAEGVSTPAALVVRAAKLTIPTGRAAKRKKPTLVARGEMDIGGTQVDLEGAATLWVGDTQIAISEFASLRRGRLLRYDEDGIRLDLKPSAKGASRVPFALRVVGDVAAALDKDGELFLRFKSGAFDAMGVVTLLGGQFNPARGKGTWIDPELNLLSVAATPKRKSFKMRATFPPDELPATAPEVSVLLDIFEISFEPSAFKQRGATKYVLSRKLGPVRQKVVLDYRRGTLTIVLNGVALQTYEPGTVQVPLAVSIGTTQLQDRPMLVVTKRSFRY